MVKNLPAKQEMWIRSLGQEDSLEKEMTTHSSTLAWEIPWTEESGRLQSIGLQRVGHDLACPTITITIVFSRLLRTSRQQVCSFPGVLARMLDPMSQENALSQFTLACSCLVAKLCPTLCDPMDCNLPGSSDHGIFQARVQEWVAISFSKR